MNGASLSGAVPASAITIDDFDVQRTPSLVGYWKCNEGQGSSIKDYSQYGHDLTHYLVADTVDPWSTFPGYAAVSGLSSWRVPSAGTPLETGGNFVVLCAELNYNSGMDYDSGQSWKLAGTQQPTYGGIILAGAGNHIMSAIYNPNQDFPTLSGGAAVQTAGYNTTDEHINIAGAFSPGVSVNCWFNDDGNLGLQNKTIATTITQVATPQKSGGIAYVGFGGGGVVGYRNYTMWSFASEPPMLDVTLQWMARYPGKVPIWWEGL